MGTSKGMCGSCKRKKSFLFLFDYRRAEDPWYEYSKDQQRGPVAFFPYPFEFRGTPLQWRPIDDFVAKNPDGYLGYPEGDPNSVPRRVPGTPVPPGSADALSPYFSQLRMRIQQTSNSSSEAVTQAHLKTSIKDVQRLIENEEDPNSIALALGQMESERETLSGGTEVCA